MVLNYRKGYNFEVRVARLFQKFGFVVQRKAASKPYDLLVMKDGKAVFAVDAKKTSQKNKDCIHVGKKDVEKIIKQASKLNCYPLLIYSFSRSPVFVEFPNELLKKPGKTVKLEKSLTLKGFLKSFVKDLI